MLPRQMRLGLNIVANGAHAAGWRMPGAEPDALDIRLWRRIARAAEAACIHFMFWADGIAVRSMARDEDELSYLGRVDVFEPLTLIGALSQVTEHLGFVASASTTYNEPYHVARKFASLDHISEGRVGWNIVTSWSEQEAHNFGRDRHMEHGTRYRRAEEFVDVVLGLWDGWEDEAFIRDKESGRYFDPGRLHMLRHRGESFRVKGPLNVSRPLQGYPVLAQAGSSGPGQGLGARVADLIYTAQNNKAAALAFYASVKAHGAAAGRDPGAMLVMPGILPIIGPTRAEAQASFDAMQALVHEKLGLPMLRDSFGDLAGADLDGPIPAPLAEINAVRSNHDAMMRVATERGLNLRGLYRYLAGASGHNIAIGTVEDVCGPYARLVRVWGVRRVELDAAVSSGALLPYVGDAGAGASAAWGVPDGVCRADVSGVHGAGAPGKEQPGGPLRWPGRACRAGCFWGVISGSLLCGLSSDEQTVKTSVPRC